MSTRRLHASYWLLAGVLAAAIIAVVAVALFTRTEPGRERILAYTLNTLGGRLNGELEVSRLEGNLFTGAKLYEISLTDDRGEPLLLADSAYINYELATFLGGDVVINNVVIYDSEVLLLRLPTDTAWNYQRILVDTATGPGRATLIERMSLVDAHVVVRLPWEPDEELSDEEREREVEVALADTSRLVVERVEGGLLRTMEFEIEQARAAELVVAPDERGGTYLAVEDMNGTAFLWSEPPLRILGLQGELGLRAGVLRYEATAVRLPESRLVTSGVVDLRGEEPAYDLVVAGEDVALPDLQWLYPPLPDEGTISAQLALETRPEGLLIRARDLDVTAPDTHLTGDFGLVLGDTLRFVEVDLQADPLDVDTVERMLPADLPVEGLRIGSAVIRGTSS